MRGVETASDDEAEHPAILTPGDQRMPGLTAKRLKIADRGAIRGEHPQPLTRRHGTQLAICAQYRQWTAQAFEIKNQIGHRGQFAPWLAGRASPGCAA